ncbi:ParB N-terminal domain-containing protein [Clostridium sp.]|uniref:ParB N-terminal domain-containing protein n=1 Tax=Clostridium sp. TaxID=1506 RepID=UPI00284B0394|nr:ParB N-terminal domain-containing protein [Clostridium sp.]MDR3598774.1 ParB N-terminal domain-containing protein [Clostridium sp.]
MNEALKTNNDLIISTEFKSLIRELSHSELSELESSIKEFGCLSPIVVWGSRNIIIDGHNRYDICKRNNIEYKTANLEFLNENDAKMWVIKNQFSRRNLSTYERSILALQLETIIKEKAKENQLSGLKQNTVQQNSAKREKDEINTNKELSKLAGVSHDTIARVRKIEECADEVTKESLLKSKMSINEAYEKIKKENLKKSITKIENPADESEKYDVIYSHYYELSIKTKSEIRSIVNECRGPAY